jgi:hypothetical protein
MLAVKGGVSTPELTGDASCTTDGSAAPPQKPKRTRTKKAADTEAKPEANEDAVTTVEGTPNPPKPKKTKKAVDTEVKPPKSLVQGVVTEGFMKS